MKKLFRLLLVVSLVALGTNSAFGQKFGTINSEELISLMPELDSVQIKMKAYGDEIQAQLETIQVEFNQKYEDLQTKGSTYSEGVRQLKNKELEELQSRYENYRVIAQQEGQKLQQQLMAPIIERAKNAIEKVATTGSYWLVFDESAQSTVYTDKTHVINMLSAVKKELGIPENAKPRGAQ